MMARNIGGLPSHGAPSREDFLKLDDRQKDQINDVFSVFDIDKDGSSTQFLYSSTSKLTDFSQEEYPTGNSGSV